MSMRARGTLACGALAGIVACASVEVVSGRAGDAGSDDGGAPDGTSRDGASIDASALDASSDASGQADGSTDGSGDEREWFPPTGGFEGATSCAPWIPGSSISGSLALTTPGRTGTNACRVCLVWADAGLYTAVYLAPPQTYGAGNWELQGYVANSPSPPTYGPVQATIYVSTQDGGLRNAGAQTQGDGGWSVIAVSTRVAQGEWIYDVAFSSWGDGGGPACFLLDDVSLTRAP